MSEWASLKKNVISKKRLFLYYYIYTIYSGSQYILQIEYILNHISCRDKAVTVSSPRNITFSGTVVEVRLATRAADWRRRAIAQYGIFQFDIIVFCFFPAFTSLFSYFQSEFMASSPAVSRTFLFGELVHRNNIPIVIVYV